MKTKHTPGPWTVENHVDSFSIRAIKTSQDHAQIPENRTVIDTILTIDAGTLPSRVNAQLIAAAPDMLEALEQAQIALECRGLKDTTWDIIRAAIKKAKGEV